jgi:nucleoid-associated protein YejK
MTWKQINSVLKKKRKKLAFLQNAVFHLQNEIKKLDYDAHGCIHDKQYEYLVADRDQTRGCYECDRDKAHRK